MNNNRNDEPALLGVFSKSNYITFGTKEDPFPFNNSKALQRDALKGKQMMTRPALQGRTPDTYFGKKHLYVAEGCPFVDRLKYQETQKVKPKKGFHTSDYSRRDEFSMTFRTDQHRELLKLEAKHAKRALQQMAAASHDGTLAAMEASLPKPKPQPEVFLYDLVFDTDSGSGCASKLARDTKNPTALSHERDNGHYVTTTSHAHPAFKSSTPFTKPEHVHKPVIHDTFYRKTNVCLTVAGFYHSFPILGMEDPFDSAINLEDQHIQEGYLKGIENGRKEGFKEGRELGVVKGFEIASEVGFYRGCTQAWRHVQRLTPSDIPARADKAITAMEVILDSFPLRDPRNEHIHDAVEDLRAKHKAVTAMVSTKASGGPSRNAGPALDFLEF